MRKFKILCIALVALFALESCTIAKVSSKGSVPVMLSPASADMELMEHVTVEKLVKFDFTNSHDVTQLLAEKISEKKPDAIANVTVEAKMTFVSYLLNAVTCNIANARLVVVEADFMQYADPNNPKKKKRGKR